MSNGKTYYACSDLHGNMAIWMKIRSMLNDEHKLIMLGDCTDRGQYGWRMLKDILNCQYVVYVRGNHDNMLLDRVKHLNSRYYADLHNHNGGKPTWDAMLDDKGINIDDTLFKLDCTPYSISYTNVYGKKIYLSHSGAYETNFYDMIWSRDCEDNRPAMVGFDYIVHGHTPIQYMDENNPVEKAYEYNHGRIDIDAGTAESHKAILLNLENMDSEIITDDYNLQI